MDICLFDVKVSFATLFSAPSRGQLQMADDQNHGNYFFLDSFWTEEGKERHNI